jgi:predicted ArsR family transcriptional regulator
MEKIDARKHSPETQYEIRKQVVRLRKQGFLNKDVAEGVSVGRASKIWQTWAAYGREAYPYHRTGGAVEASPD